VADRLFLMIDDFSKVFRTNSSFNLAPARDYLSGLMQAKSGSKNIERMEEVVPDLNYQSVQQFISDSPWAHRPLIDQIALDANAMLGGHSRTRLVIDETYFLKKGKCSVGVARQYNGRVGKVDNSQVAVFTSLAAGQQSTLIDTRLYLPKQWTDDPERCAQAGVPEACAAYKSKAQLALESVLHIRNLGVSFDCVSFDSGYGSDTFFLYKLDDYGEVFVGEIHSNQKMWLECPFHHHEGKRPNTVLKKALPSGGPAIQVDQWAQEQPADSWQRLKVRDSDQGWVEVNYLAERVWVAHEGDERLFWLLVWENPDDKHGRRHYAYSNAPATADARVLIQDGVGRNVVERNFRDGKSEVGMADYQVRGWTGWHHHMSLVMLAMLFLFKEKLLFVPPKDTPELTAGEIVFVLERLLPRRDTSKKEVFEMLKKRRTKRETDQKRRREKAARERPALLPDEMVPK
jgi:SRSO17 transposase